ncbi:hypothetical protein Q5P01_014949 [Channa striata]|uniref:Uncharacterized protein n=1 Tax=Channa striata TaxID=64152 RepID=A0AA88MJQ5_CHASR|nr:hypothetical protein Q5P01_014949 [Channa striata]
MSRRESRGSRGVNRELEDMRRQMEAKVKEMEVKLRTATKIIVLKERDIWQQDREQLLEENRSLQKQLSIMKEDNGNLQTDLQKANEEEIISLHKFEESSGFETAEEEWRRKVSKLEELLAEKEKEISRAIEKKQARTRAHVETLADLTETQSALKQSQLSCVALEEKLQTLLAEKEERFRKELSGTEGSVKKKLREKNRRKERGRLHKELKSRMEPVEFCDIWQSKAQQWQTEKMELVEMLLVNPPITFGLNLTFLTSLNK